MTARAEAAERTRVAILDAAVHLATTRLLAHISLDDIASEAGVSVQTVLRRFGSRAGLIDAATAHAGREVGRGATGPGRRHRGGGEARGGLTTSAGATAWVLLLAQETTDPQVRRITDNGRRLHREWVERVFAPYLPTPPAPREALVDLLAVATDVYTWKLLRRDRGLDRTATEHRIRQFVSALTAQE